MESLLRDIRLLCVLIFVGVLARAAGRVSWEFWLLLAAIVIGDWLIRRRPHEDQGGE